jgi:hypothetical protein
MLRFLRANWLWFAVPCLVTLATLVALFLLLDDGGVTAFQYEI